MRFVRYVILICLGLFLLYAKLTSPPTSSTPTPVAGSPSGLITTPPPASGPASTVATAPVSTAAAVPTPDQPAADRGVPAKVTQVLEVVRTTGQPPEGYVGGRTFENREGRLPAGGDYREFDVDPHNGQRNAERIIIEWSTKKAWYTADHYQTFTPLP